MKVKGEIEFNDPDTLADIQLITELPKRIRAIEERMEKMSEDIIILRDVLRSLGSEIRGGRRYP